VLRKYCIRCIEPYLDSGFVESVDAIIRVESQGSIEISLKRIPGIRRHADIPSAVFPVHRRTSGRATYTILKMNVIRAKDRRLRQNCIREVHNCGEGARVVSMKFITVARAPELCP
jgi:hypothetical protein